MRPRLRFGVLLLGAACSSLGHAPTEPLGAPGSITLVSARFEDGCASQADDVTPLFRQACEGRWRCAVRTPRDLSARQHAIEVAWYSRCGPARYAVDWTCGKGTETRTLSDRPGTRFRISCPNPDARGEENSAVVVPAAQPMEAPNATRNLGPGAVHGAFLGTARTSAAGIRMAIGSQQTWTDEGGAFTLAEVPARYDLAVIGDKGTRVALYLGLSRRDPVVAYSEPPHNPHAGREGCAHISARLQGPQLTGKNPRASVSFWWAGQSLGDNHGSDLTLPWDSYHRGPDDILVSWGGPPAVTGRLLAFVSAETSPRRRQLVGIASKRVTLADGDNLGEHLSPKEVSSGRISGTWNPEANPLVTSLVIHYEMSDGSGNFVVATCPLRDAKGDVTSNTGPAGPGPERPFECPLPDVTSLPGQYAVSHDTKSAPGPAKQQLTTCNIHLGITGSVLPCTPRAQVDRARIVRPPSVRLTSPGEGSIGVDSVFAWEALGKSVYAIDMFPMHKPSSLVPRIFLFTTRTSFRWADLATHGIGFPNGTNYMVSVAPVPVSSVDELASLGWWYGQAGVEQQADPESQLVELHDPTAPIPDSLAPFERTELDSLPQELPPCPSTTKGQRLGSGDFGKMVTVTGLLERRSLLCGDDGSLPRRPCTYLWYIAKVAGSSEPLALALAKPDSQDPEGPIPIAATGILVPPHHGDELGLQQAKVCALPLAARQFP